MNIHEKNKIKNASIETQIHNNLSSASGMDFFYFSGKLKNRYKSVSFSFFFSSF